MIRVSDYIAQHLRQVGVDAVFMLSGGGMMHLIDAVGRVEGLRYFCGHHEQALAMAADAYGRLTGRPGVCYATSGPGATNILTGVVGAWQDSSPTIFITGQSKRSQSVRGAGHLGLRQLGTFEVDIVPVMAPVTKYAVFIDDPRLIRFHLEKALHLALSGRPGPALLDVPLDVQGAMIDPEQLIGYAPPEDVDPPFTSRAAADILDAVARAEKPLILAGHGVRASGAAAAFRLLVERLGVPVAVTQLGKDLLAYDHPLFVGHPGVKGDRAGNFAVQNADLILTLGSSLHAQTVGYEAELFAPGARIIHIDPDPAVLIKPGPAVSWRERADLGQAIPLLADLAAARPPRRDGGWSEACRTWKLRRPVSAEPHIVDGPINYYELVDKLSVAAPADAVVVADAGSSFYVMGQAFRLKDGQRFISSGSLGAMGFALPAAIGACVAEPGRMAICVTGDGSLQTNIQELQMMRHYGFNLKLFVVNNDGYVSIRNTQNAFFDGHLVGASQDSGVSFPPLDKIADAYGLPYVGCADRDGLDAAIRATLATPGPAICGIEAQADQKIIPTVTSERLPDGRIRSKPLDQMAPDLPPL